MSYTYTDYPPRPSCYPPMITNPAPNASPSPVTTGGHRTISIVPGIQEQMGTDPISKLAAAIEKLADALKSEGLGG